MIAYLLLFAVFGVYAVLGNFVAYVMLASRGVPVRAAFASARLSVSRLHGGRSTCKHQITAVLPQYQYGVLGSHASWARPSRLCSVATVIA